MSNNNSSLQNQGKKSKLSVWVRKIMQPAKDNNNVPLQSRTTTVLKSSSPTEKVNYQRSSKKDTNYRHSIDIMDSISNDPDSKTISSSLRPMFTSNSNSASTIEKNTTRTTTDTITNAPKITDTSVNANETANTNITTTADENTSINPPAKLSWDEKPKKVKIDLDYNGSSTDNASMQPLVSVCSSSVNSSTFSDVNSIQSTRATVFSSRTLETNSSTMAIPPASILDRTRRSSLATPGNANTGSISGTSNASNHHSGPQPVSRPGSIRHNHLQRNNSGRTVNSIITLKS
ncbi:hypothetical protein Kpol_1031p25 [Vanderwaltozyma polyspora DSM 70294]|uniref:Uncharacterized protein n=1 Tax=Vanderwaltozyma polyspora (strain ATCC 22028 / DSM 70294 / BCRC 21397 / CBS 2163 / NBRC 10782 / NRRL Y-8283 / UCD 57-17) TaxID=436907 RepID=A7THV9_VANPO|nr:uncharacterized protein Kpol_1031p25 [Vanderwaltozyma polyspora DSM 70294]EDO18121.1 hypothetical protein Kpol_1031p25 [Vanderwaltozyma polyspora DSM 70294]